MTWIKRGLLGVALTVVLSCGPGKDDSVRVAEGETLEGIFECPTLLCGVNELCTEVLFEYGRSPPLCLPIRYKKEGEGEDIPPHETCELFECVGPGKRCVIFDGIPFQLRCVDDEQ